MDLTQTEISKYLENLPENIKGVIYNSDWEVRVDEIAKKYSLNQDQTESLSNSILMVLAGIEEPATFSETIMADLSISGLLTEQIMDDLDSRVFDYVSKILENNEKKVPTTAIEIRPTSNVPEIKPDNVPMKEENHSISVPRYSPAGVKSIVGFNPESVIKPAPPISVPPPISLVEKPSVPAENPSIKPSEIASPDPTPSVIKYAKTAEPAAATETNRAPEMIQRPVFVPRFGGTLIDSTAPGGESITTAAPVPEKPQIPPAAQPAGIIENKLAGPTSATIEKPQAPAETPPTHSYAVDPYREPLE